MLWKVRINDSVLKKFRSKCDEEGVGDTITLQNIMADWANGWIIPYPETAISEKFRGYCEHIGKDADQIIFDYMKKYVEYEQHASYM